MIDLSYVQEQIEMKKREELLKKHPHSSAQGKDGRWITYIPDKEKGRKMIRKKTKEEVENIIIAFWKEEAENPTIRELFYEWMKRKLEYKDICVGSFNRYEKDFKRYFEDDSDFAN